VPFQKRREGGLVFATHEAIHEVGVADLLGSWYGQKRSNGPDGKGPTAWHLSESPNCYLKNHLYLITATKWVARTVFFEGGLF
jgi:hypothetical protein